MIIKNYNNAPFFINIHTNFFLFIIQDRLAYDIKQTINNNESINELER